MKKFIKFIYKIIPFKKGIFTAIKYFWIPSKSLSQHLHFNSIIKIKAHSENSFYMQHYGYMIENELFWHGIDNAWEKISFKLWKALSENSEIILDIGANTGVYSLISGSMNPLAQIYSFEPIKSVFEKLNYNIGLNSFKSEVKSYEVALSDFTGEATIYMEKNATHALSVTVNKSLLPDAVEYRTEKIKTIRLDEFIEKESLKKIDLIKIDVETHEPEVLSGMGIYLKKFRPTILIEILTDEIGEQVQALVQNLNYLYFNIDEKSGEIIRTKNISKSNYFNYLICDEEKARFLKLI
ncbi:MAG: methyltransferase [Mucilaginibacter sp.]|uniref:FkbM family methyltransferase n=1 Tax=Mucilaginibacter sp. TaxID=1882438 RepID=UPI0026161B5A|nr:FkbM family methyltransferase [Mucilaginibacter sp.]MDB5001954.1 methyltransferase [Mucilaginibacter sp.]